MKRYTLFFLLMSATGLLNANLAREYCNKRVTLHAKSPNQSLVRKSSDAPMFVPWKKGTLVTAPSSIHDTSKYEFKVLYDKKKGAIGLKHIRSGKNLQVDKSKKYVVQLDKPRLGNKTQQFKIVKKKNQEEVSVLSKKSNKYLAPSATRISAGFRRKYEPGTLFARSEDNLLSDLTLKVTSNGHCGLDIIDQITRDNVTVRLRPAELGKDPVYFDVDKNGFLVLKKVSHENAKQFKLAKHYDRKDGTYWIIIEDPSTGKKLQCLTHKLKVKRGKKLGKRIFKNIARFHDESQTKLTHWEISGNRGKDGYERVIEHCYLRNRRSGKYLQTKKVDAQILAFGDGNEFPPELAIEAIYHH